MNKASRQIAKGSKFGALTTVGETFVQGKTRRVECVCVCGTRKVVRVDHLLDGTISSCGCQKAAKISNSRTVHGEWTTRLWGLWSGMRRRCNTTSTGNYSLYGGRGIEVCDEWKDYLAFRSWALANGYEDSLTLDRIDVNGPYSPENCRWVSMQEQAWNRRSTVYVEFEGKSQPLAKLAKQYNMDDELVYSRVVALKWPVLKALTTPKRRCRRTT